MTATVPLTWAQTTYYTVAGTQNGFLGSDWSPGDTNNDMVAYGSTYYYLAKTGNVNSGSYAFKVTKDHSWNESYPGTDYYYNVSSTGTWSIVYLFNTSGNNVSLFGPFKTLTVAGSQTEVLGSSWGETDSNNDMSTTNGIDYTLTFTDVHVTAGSYKFKVALDHSWDTSWPGSDKEYNVEFTGIADVTFGFNVITQAVSVNVIEKAVTPTNYYAVGDNTTIFPNGWGTGQATLMSDEDEDGVYTWTSGEIHLDANTNYTYKVYGDDNTWHPTGTSGNLTFSVDVPGTYTVTVTYDSNNETVNATTTVIQPDPSYTFNIFVRYTGNENPGNVYLHAWDANGNKTTWPGLAFADMTSTIINSYTYYMASYTGYASTMGVLFNENGSVQTVDLALQPGDNYFT